MEPHSQPMKVDLERIGGIVSFFGSMPVDVFVNTDGRIYHVLITEFKDLYHDPLSAQTS